MMAEFGRAGLVGTRCVKFLVTRCINLFEDFEIFWGWFRFFFLLSRWGTPQSVQSVADVFWVLVVLVWGLAFWDWQCRQCRLSGWALWRLGKSMFRAWILEIHFCSFWLSDVWYVPSFPVAVMFFPCQIDHDIMEYLGVRCTGQCWDSCKALQSHSRWRFVRVNVTIASEA